MKKIGGSGCIHYNFITLIDPNSKDFIDFQLHQRIFGIIGFIHDSDNENTGSESLLKLKENIPYEVSHEIFHIDSSMDLKENLKMFTLKVIETMSNLFKDINQRPSIPSPCGIEDYSGTASRSSTSTSTKLRMRMSGRIQKLLADLHLLTGSFSDAVACYVSAAEDAKQANDSIWSAASQEGFNLALCLQNEVRKMMIIQ